MKRCKKCGETKPLSEFHKHRKCKQGVRPKCKVCNCAEAKAWRDANLERAQAHDRWRYYNQPGRRKANIDAAHRSYRKDPEASLANRQAYYLANQDVWERARAKRRASKAAVEHQPYTRREIFDRDGGHCRICGTELRCEPHGFHIDHIVPISLGGPDTPANVQLTCPPCNLSKWRTIRGQIYLPVG